MPLFIDVFYYFLLLWLHPFISSLPVPFHHLSIGFPHRWTPPFAYCLPLWFLPGLSSPPLCLFAVSLRWREWKLDTDHCSPAADVHDRPLRSAAPHAQYAGSWKWLALYIWTGFPYTYSAYHRLPKAYRGNTPSTCINFQNVVRLIVESEGGLPFPLPVPSLDLSYILTICQVISFSLLINPAVKVLLKSSETW